MLVPLCSRHGRRKIFDATVVQHNKFPGCHFERHNSKQGRRYFVVFTPAKRNQHLPKLAKALPRQNIFAVLSHKRIGISEPNSGKKVAKTLDSHLKPAFVKLTTCVRVVLGTTWIVCRTSIPNATQRSVRASVLVKLSTCVRGRTVDNVDSLQDLNPQRHPAIWTCEHSCATDHICQGRTVDNVNSS